MKLEIERGRRMHSKKLIGSFLYEQLIDNMPLGMMTYYIEELSIVFSNTV